MKTYFDIQNSVFDIHYLKTFVSTILKREMLVNNYLAPAGVFFNK